MKIGQLAQRSGVNIDTVRYYEREGLLPKAQRLSSGYRVYDDSDVKRLPDYSALRDHIWRLVKDEALQTARGGER